MVSVYLNENKPDLIFMQHYLEDCLTAINSYSFVPEYNKKLEPYAPAAGRTRASFFPSSSSTSQLVV